ncbi:Hsp70 family protein [Streptomyces xanthophaeus]|uniref:Hsp70 family protein n=1 Tax=Streptomyces xanthophaeus TaxID=67385 RepID=UPI003427C70F
MTRTIGINLGATNAVAVWLDGDTPRAVTNTEGSGSTPVAVGFGGGSLLVGDSALLAAPRPGSVASGFRDRLGTDWTVTLDGAEHTAVELVGHLLAYLKSCAEAASKDTVTGAVIAVPSGFTDAQRRALVVAAARAGLSARTVDAPAATVVAHGLDKEADGTRVLVVHLGGATCTATVLTIDGNTPHVTTTCGDGALGGQPWTAALANWGAEEFGRRTRAEAPLDAGALARLAREAERVKHALSSSTVATFTVENLVGAEGLAVDVSRPKFELLTRDLLARVAGLAEQVLKDAGGPAGGVDHLVLSGAATRMPKVPRQITTLLGGTTPRGDVPAHLVAAYGALRS